jgi:hypothetical protein
MIKIESGIPAPTGRKAVHGKMAMLRIAMKAMKVGDSFIWNNQQHPFEIADEMRIKITTRKISTGEYRVWRIV